MSKVYITQAPRITLDVTSAAEFGDLVTLLPAGRIPLENNDAIRRRLEEGLDSFNPEKDYILCLGDMYIGVLCGLVLGGWGVDTTRIRFLRWDHKKGGYVVGSLPAYNEGEENAKGVRR